ncbi:protein SRG1-like isoform X2 [Camellia sinensis]|uniref:protein SRG1-like isoform X2 n=1 Tax=Camellia sinensis TaxID=4442 RepID=UPI001035574C|nr:protein SRG1-like isoform X2 [Camellia sinensis]
MEAKLTRLGSSLLVPTVQELAKESLTTVPPRYVHHDHQNHPISSYGARCPDDVPIIDMDKLISGDHMDLELKKLNYASKEWGFFQLINHGVSSSLAEKVKMETREFFNLPMEEKKKFWQDPGDVEGFGQAFVVSEEQKLDWGDLFFLTTLPTHLRKPNLFPMLPLPFRHTLEVYTADLKHLAMKILDYMAKALKMKAEDMRELFEEGMQAVRMNYYPPCPQPELVAGLTPHSDAVGLTILLQLNDVEGLQIKKDGMWVPVKPLSDAFVVNIGDILEIVTNGTYRSIEHRAVVNSSKERLSIATFYNPRLDGEMGPAPSLITPQTPARFKRIRVQDYFTGLFARELHGKSYLDVMRIENEESQNST